MTPGVARLLRGTGWLLVTAGTLVLLYVVYLVWFTGVETQQAQRQLAEAFAAPQAAVGFDGDIDGEPDDPGPPVPGEAFAVLWFERDGERLFDDDPLYVVEGTGVADLRLGPGHYVDSAQPGEDGNLGIAGHRTTHGAPFSDLDQLTDGDTIHVVDRGGTQWVYAYREQRIVTPADVWVVREPDPIDLDGPTITLTTCHPRYSAAQRLVAWGELVDSSPVDDLAATLAAG